MLILNNISYYHKDKTPLFENLQLALPTGAKAALIANNGMGKSTLLKLIAGEIVPTAGNIAVEQLPYYIPQVLDKLEEQTVAAALKIDKKLEALYQILDGEVTEENLQLLDDDWSLEERVLTAFARWNIADIQLNQQMSSLSGGQKSKVYLAGIHIYQAKFILMDEPNNHLDLAGRQLLYDFIQQTNATLLIVSHDRTLLNLLDCMYELHPAGIRTYGGNYEFFAAQKQLEQQALGDHIQAQEKELRKARERERDVLERQQRLDSRGAKKQIKAGVSRIMMNTLRNQAEQSSAKLKHVQQNKIGDLSEKLTDLRMQRPDVDKIKFGFESTGLHQGKVLFELQAVNHSYGLKPTFAQNLDLKIFSGERMAITGNNGSGKTSLINILLGKLLPNQGQLFKADLQSIYIDQDYSLLNPNLSVFEQAEAFNDGSLQEHDVKIRLDRFLFNKDAWHKRCADLSGGERMRLALCCLTIVPQAPDLIVLDEPTNNLDIQNIQMLSNAIQQYKGTLIVVSHDQQFLSEIGLQRTIAL